MPKMLTMEPTADPGHEEYVFFCPGCSEHHSFIVKWGPKHLANRVGRVERGNAPPGQPPTWTFNGDMEKPTFAPSLLYKDKSPLCHLFLRDGIIEYLGDCGHALKGQKVPMEDVG